MDNPKSIFDLISEGGTLALLIMAVWALISGMVVPRSRLEAAEKRHADERKERQDRDAAGRTAMVEAMLKVDRTLEKLDELDERLERLEHKLDVALEQRQHSR